MVKIMVPDDGNINHLIKTLILLDAAYNFPFYYPQNISFLGCIAKMLCFKATSSNCFLYVLSHTSYAVSLIHFGLLSNFKRNFLLWLQYLKLYRIFKVQRKNYLTSCTHRSLASIVFVQSFLITKSFLILFHPEHTRLSYPLPSPGTCSNSCPLSWWCHPTIPSSVTPFSSCPQSFPASESFFQWVSSLYQVAQVLELQFQ